MAEKIFITGASGCIGTYVIEHLSSQEQYELHLLCRDPARIRISLDTSIPIKIHQGDLERIEEMKSVIADMDYIIHIATDWSDSDYATLLNVEKTEKLFSYCSPKKCKKIIYFSTASILGKGNKVIKEADTQGTGYVRSKYRAYKMIQNSPLKDRIFVLYPTLVFGGDSKHPYSHVSTGIKPSLHYLKWLRHIYLDATFHFIHAKDIAPMVTFLIARDVNQREFVLGNPFVTGKQVIKALCKAFDISMFIQIKINSRFVLFLAKLFKIKIAPWDLHCIKNPYMKYDVVSPKSFGLFSHFPNLKILLNDIKVTT
jgi:nucleoside-diphosphate-sugar epimerase